MTRPQNGPQTIDGETGQPIATPEQDGGADKSKKQRRRIDLTTLKDVRAELAIVYRKMDAEEIESQEGTRRAYVLKTIADVIALAELEKRIEALEEGGAQGMNGTRPALPAEHSTH